MNTTEIVLDYLENMLKKEQKENPNLGSRELYLKWVIGIIKHENNK